MGPGQFIPSTWVCYGGFVNVNSNTCTPSGINSFWLGPWQYSASKDRVRRLLGASEPSNPWSAQVAIMATAMLMADNGAAKQTPAAERLAALRYFAGGHANNPAYAFYGDGVMGFAAQFQQDINQLSGL
jgi:membrane-bound lytic murein transglycosylase B